MLSILSNEKKIAPDDLIQELINPESTNEVLDEIYKITKVDLNSLNFNDEPILHVCCKKDIYISVLWLLENKIDINIQNEHQETALFYAIYSRNSSLLQMLVDFGANINQLNISNRTALQESLNSANGTVIRYLLQVTTLIDNIDVHGNNLLFDAVVNGNENTIKQIASFSQIDINHINKAGNTVLHLSNVLHNISLAELLIDLGVNPTIPNQKGESYLFYLVQNGAKYIKLIKKISSFKYDLNLKNKSNKNILMEAVCTFLQIPSSNDTSKDGQRLLIKELFDLNIDIEARDNNKENVSFYITRSEDKDLISSLFSNFKIDLNIQNNEGFSPFLYMVLSGNKNKELIKLYLDKGANANLKTVHNKSVIEILINIILHLENNQELEQTFINLLEQNAEYKQVLELIFRHSNVDLNALNSLGEPLFFKSILNFNFRLFAILKLKNLDLKKKDKDGNNIIFRLINHNNNDLIKDKKLYLNTLRTLINTGIDINAKNNNGLTALHIAISQKCEYTIQLLLNLSADYFATDKNGRTIMHMLVLNNSSKYFNLVHNLNKGLVEIVDSFGVKAINYAAFMGKAELVLEMIKQGCEIDNSIKKHPSILKFLEKFHSNLLSLSKKAKNEIDEEKLKRLVDNMKKEFEVKD